MPSRGAVTTGLKLLSLMSNPDCKFIVTEFDMENMVFETVSSSALKLIGFSPEEMVGKSPKDFVDQSFVVDTMKEAEEIKNPGEPEAFINIYDSKDGKKVVMMWVSSDTTTSHAICIAIPISLKTLEDLKNVFDKLRVEKN